MVLDNVSEQDYVSCHNEVSSCLVDFYPGEIILALKGEIPPKQYVETSTASGFLRVASAFADNISTEETHKTVFIVTIVNVDSHVTIIVEYETAVVIQTHFV